MELYPFTVPFRQQSNMKSEDAELGEIFVGFFLRVLHPSDKVLHGRKMPNC